MLNWNSVLYYVKSMLSLPSTYIEKTDEEIKEHIKHTALPEFSAYFPDVERCLVYPSLAQYRVPGYNNRFYFFDEENLSIIGIKEVYFQLHNEFISGHPIIGPMSFEGLEWFALSVLKASILENYTNFFQTYKFFQPNIIEVLPSDVNTSSFVVEYERHTPPDLSKIPVAMEMSFKDLALAHVELWIGNLRTMYSDTQTPFGSIPLNGETLFNRGQERREKVVQLLTEETIPPIYIDIM